MFDFLKRKEECTEIVQQPEENLLREYKKREAEAKKEVREKEREIDRLNDQIEKLRKERNTLITAADMAEDRLRKEEQRMKEKEDCSAWLRSKLEEYGNWERVTKTELIGIIRTAIEK